MNFPTAADPAGVVCEVDRGVGRVLLDRPASLNALTTPMLRTIASALDAWADDVRVRTVVIEGAGERAFCAGGDLRAMRASALADDAAAPEFFRVEYAVDARIARYPKPVVSLMHGVTMGGGIGLGSHASVRVVTDDARVAMPEVGIGLVPDVGGTYLLSRAGVLGAHLALTGATVGAADAVAAGLADHVVPAASLGAVRRDLFAGAPPADVVSRHALPPSESSLRLAPWLDCYAEPTVEGVLARLEEHGDPEASAAAATIRSKSPTAVKVTFESLRRALDLPDLEHVLEQEFRVSCACLRTPDLVEGIRAQVVDKDRRPRWQPETIDAVDDLVVDSFFRPTRWGRVGLVSA